MTQIKPKPSDIKPRQVPERCGFKWRDGWGEHTCFHFPDGHGTHHTCECDAYQRASRDVHCHGPEEGDGVDCQERLTRAGMRRGACLTDGGVPVAR